MLASEDRVSLKIESDEEYDSEDERYQRYQQRLLKKVEESASAIRALNEITRPFITGAWRIEREEESENEESNPEGCSLLTPTKRKELPTPAPQIPSIPAGRSSPSSFKRKSLWSPVLHVKTTGARAVLEMEKTPSWKPLRKSKARQSLALLNTENACRTVELNADDVSSACKPLSGCSTPVVSSKSLEEYRTPLRAVVGSNQALERRLSTSQPTETEPSTCTSDPEGLASRTAATCLASEDPTCNNESDSKELETVSSEEILSSQGSDVTTPVSKVARFSKSIKSPVRCSPILLQAYGEDYAQVRGSIVSPDKFVNINECTSPKDLSKVLKGVVAYVEVRRGEDDRTGGFRWKLKQLGACVSNNLNKKVTHVVFQEGLLSTFRKAKQIGAHIVSTHWVMACDETFTKIQESRYPIENLDHYELADPLQKTIKRPKIMSPDVGSIGNDKVLSKRLQRRSMKVDSPLTKPPNYVLPVIKTPSPLKKSRFMKKNSTSPKLRQDQGYDSDDDWDGFLSLVEAQVREKAEARRKAGEISETQLDFETRLQMYLGRSDKGTATKDSKPPLASIFQRGKVPATLKVSPKKITKPKVNTVSAASSSVMRNWLQRHTPENGMIRDVSSASDAADEILNSMLKSCETSQDSNVSLPTAVKVGQGFGKTAIKAPSTQSMLAKDKLNSQSTTQEHFVFSAKSKPSNISCQVRKKAKGKRIGFQGQEACSGALQNWLVGSKLPLNRLKPHDMKSPSPAVFTSQTEKDYLKENNKKRKADCLNSESIIASSETPSTSNPSKRHCGKETPEKASDFDKKNASSNIRRHGSTSSSDLLETPTKSNGRTPNHKHKKTDLTPRRRSMRLTPVKIYDNSSYVTALETVEER